jgi:hypothetical protein
VTANRPVLTSQLYFPGEPAIAATRSTGANWSSGFVEEGVGRFDFVPGRG